MPSMPHGHFCRYTFKWEPRRSTVGLHPVLACCCCFNKEHVPPCVYASPLLMYLKYHSYQATMHVVIH